MNIKKCVKAITTSNIWVNNINRKAVQRNTAMENSSEGLCRQQISLEHQYRIRN